MKRRFLTVFALMMALVLAITLVACNDYVEPSNGEEEEETITRTQLVPNGTFYNATSSTSDSYVKETVKDWTATKGSLATTASGVTMGVIDLAKTDVYSAQQSNFSVTESTDFKNPGIDEKTPYDTDDEGNVTTEKQDTNALVIASVLETGSMYYTSASTITIAAGKYYKLQYSVCSVIDLTGVADEDKASKGAWVRVTGGLIYEDKCINTDGKWETHELYIEGNKTIDKTIKIELWLGHGPNSINDKSNVYNCKGTAMFDNVILTEVTTAVDAKYDGGKETTLNHTNFALMTATAIDENSKIGYESMYYLSDLKFEQFTESTPTTANAKKYYYSFREGDIGKANAVNFSIVKGKDDLESAEAPSMQTATNGIVNLAKLYADDATSLSQDTFNNLGGTSYKFIAPSYDQWQNQLIGTAGGRDMTKLDEQSALMIYLEKLSGVGYKTNSTITIEKDKYYEISVWVYVYLPKESGNIVYPDDNLSEPNEVLSITQKGYNAFMEAQANYFVALTTDEKNIVDGEEPVPTTSVSDINNLLSDDTFIDTVKAWMIEQCVSAAGDYTNKTGEAMAELAKTDAVKYYYLKNNLSSTSLVASDEDYINYKYLTTRNTLINGSVIKDTNSITEKWEKYDDDKAAFDAPYTTWKSVNGEESYAKVKLTGAGDDLEKRTTICNVGYDESKGWEKISFFVKGNQLSSRNLTMEFWYGEGSAIEYENLMFGGAFFDNISITEIDKADATNPAKYDQSKWETLSPITAEEELTFGGLTRDKNANDYWEVSLADGVSSADVDKVTLTSEANTEIGKVTIADPAQEIELNNLILNNTVATASVLKMKGSDKCMEIKPNTAYRLAVWAKTVDVKEGLGATINLMGGSEKDELASVASVTAFNNEEWKEIVFYILGDSTKTNYVSFEIAFGAGTRFSIDSYIQGKLYLAVINCTMIKYSEFSASTKSGDETKSYTFANTVAATNSVTNGSFSSINYSDTDEEEFDETTGLLKDDGIATTASWTKSTVKSNTFNTISTFDMTNTASNTYKLTWSGVVGVDKNGNDTTPTSYEVYARFLEDGEAVERLWKIISARTTENINYDADDSKYFIEQDMSSIVGTSFRVRAVSNDAVSSYSGYKTTPKLGDNVLVDSDSEETGKKEFNAGTIYNDGMFAAAVTDYVSPYKTALKITSNYKVAYSMTSSSTSLTSSSFYVVSVWVKTEDDAKASVTVKNISDTLKTANDKNYIGYTGIDTDGKWTQYRFYIKTSNSSSNLEMELSLGNPYATKVTKSSTAVTSSVAVYDTANDLSMGSVYFDAVKVKTIDEYEYTLAMEAGEYNTDKTDKLHDFTRLYAAAKNQYASRILEYTTDSFDSFTNNTTSEGSDGYNLGNAPKSYTWAKSTNAVGTEEDQRMYGVYNYSTEADDKLKLIYTVESTDDVDEYNAFKDFMPETFNIRDFLKIDGYNSLVMSNKTPYGQTYTSDSVTLNTKTYYKLTFKAKTLIAKKIVNSDETVTYTTDGVNASLRFMQDSSTESYQTILINSKNRTDDIYAAVEYELYIYNPSAASKAAQWAFVLGDEEDTEDTTGVKQYLMGMVVIDQVALTKIDEADYTAAKATFDALSTDDQVKATSRIYAYNEDDETETETPKEEEPVEEEKTSIWDRGDAWLLISSIVIAAVIVVVVVVLVIRRWQKKHPKEVKGENIVKTEKEIKVVEPVIGKEDILESDEYSDDVPQKPVYVQRTVAKKKKRK